MQIMRNCLRLGAKNVLQIRKCLLEEFQSLVVLHVPNVLAKDGIAFLRETESVF